MKRTSFLSVSSKRSYRSSQNRSTSVSSALLVGAETWITMILNSLLSKWTEIILSFLRLYPSTALWTLVYYDGYSNSSKGFLPTVVDIMVIYSSWHSPGQNTGVGSLSLLQGIFPTQGLNPGLPHCRQILNQLSHKGSPRILEWVTYPFSRGSSWPRNQTRAFYIASRFFTNCAIWETKYQTTSWSC